MEETAGWWSRCQLRNPGEGESIDERAPRSLWRSTNADARRAGFRFRLQRARYGAVGAAPLELGSAGIGTGRSRSHRMRRELRRARTAFYRCRSCPSRTIPAQARCTAVNRSAHAMWRARSPVRRDTRARDPGCVRRGMSSGPRAAEGFSAVLRGVQLDKPSKHRHQRARIVAPEWRKDSHLVFLCQRSQRVRQAAAFWRETYPNTTTVRDVDVPLQ